MTSPLILAAFDDLPRSQWGDGGHEVLPLYYVAPPVAPRRCAPAVARHAAIITLLDAGHTPREVAAALGVSLATVYRALPGTHRPCTDARDAAMRAMIAEGRRAAWVGRKFGVSRMTVGRARKARG